ncbi:hypothetical protein [Streptomyces sp. NPDC012888]|uniref:hypothetical protein n=1 Tax=Streptomyces sp. NPDC012888 TaxID=3364855 RepID=UPI003676D4CC
MTGPAGDGTGGHVPVPVHAPGGGCPGGFGSGPGRPGGGGPRGGGSGGGDGGGPGGGDGGGVRGGPGSGDRGADGAFAARLRELMTEDAAALRPGQAPLPAILRRGRADRRRRRAAVTALLLVLAGAPAAGITAVLLTAEPDAGPAGTVVMGTPPPPATGTAQAPPTPPPGPGPPRTEGQLADGVTYEQAAVWLRDCLRQGSHPDAGRPERLRLLLAHRDDTGPAPDGVVERHRLVAVWPDRPGEGVRCGISDGVVTEYDLLGEQPPGNPGGPPVHRSAAAGTWWLRPAGEGAGHPYRWADFGTVGPDVARVEVRYGDVSVDAVLDHGWYAATALQGRGPGAAADGPYVEAYDAFGRRLYASGTPGAPGAP